MKQLKNYICLIRPKHCIKNIIILLPLIFNGSLFDIPKLVSVILGFVSFSLIAACVYIINDIYDAPKDRLHPIKRNRPIASGEVSEAKGKIMLALCLIFSLLFNIFAERSIASFACILCYFVINILYSNGLKNIPILDIVILTSGFVIRLIYGGIVPHIRISSWLYLTVIAISFYMGLGKRRNELERSDSRTPPPQSS